MAIGSTAFHCEARFVDLFRRKNGRPSQRKERAAQIRHILAASALDSLEHVSYDDIFRAYLSIKEDLEKNNTKLVMPAVEYQYDEYSFVNEPADTFWEDEWDNDETDLC